MIDTNDNADFFASADPVADDDADASSAGETATGTDDDQSFLRKFLEDLERSEKGARDAETLRQVISEMTAQGTVKSLNIKAADGRTLLHIAARAGLTEAAERLVNVESFLNAQDERGVTPLIEACWGEHIDIVRLLLEHRADCAIFDDDDRSPLYIAASCQCTDMVRFLLNAREWDLDYKEKIRRRTPLHAAAYGGHWKMVQYLRDRGAKLDLRDDNGWTPLMTAVVYKNVNAIYELLQRQSDWEDLQLETEDLEGRTPLLRAAEDSFWDGVHILVRAGSKYSTRRNFETPISDSSDRALPRNTALHCAVRESCFHMVRFLIENGADVNARDHEEQQPLHLASTSNDRDSQAENILGSDTNSQIDDGSRNFQPGTDSERLDMVRFLLEKGADTSAKTRHGKTAMELAFDYGHYDRAEAILDCYTKANDVGLQTLIWAASTTDRHWIAASLIKRRFHMPSGGLTAKRSDGWTAIEWAAYAGMPQVLWLLIASSPHSGETKKALRSAKVVVERLKSRSDTPVPNLENPEDHQADETKKSDRSVAMQEIRDIINNPPTGLIYTDSPTYSPTRYDATLSCIESHEATIVQFYKSQGKFNTIIRSQTVKETIYSQGPAGIMNKVINRLRQLAGSHLRQLEASANAQGPDIMSSDPNFTWIHLPATNMVWMDHLLQRIMQDEDQPVKGFNQVKSFFKDSWIEIPDKVSLSRIIRPRFVSRKMKENGIRTKDADGKESMEQRSRENQDDEPLATSIVAATALYVPYLTYSFQCAARVPKPSQLQDQTEKKSVRVRKPVTDHHPALVQRPIEMQRGGDAKSEEELAYARKLVQMRERYQTLLDEYSEDVIHGSSTLDESYYHFGEDSDSIKDKNRRNWSQVATKVWLKDRSLPRQQGQNEEEQQEQQETGQFQRKHEPGSYWLLIRVNQLWIWTINDKWLISASSHPIDDDENELLNGILDHLQRQGEAGGSNLQPGSPAEMSQLMVDYCIDSYERQPKAHDDERPEDCKLKDFPSIRQIFLKALSSIERNEAYLFDHFSELRRRLRNKSHTTTNENSKPTEAVSLDDQLAKATSKAEELSRNVRDILDELGMLQATVQYQEDVQKMMRKEAIQLPSYNGTDDILETSITATHNINDIKRLTIVAERILATIDTTLSLHQSEIANLQAGLAMQEGRVLMVFTVVTILFLPMSFLTSLFALDVASFQQAPPWALGVIFSASAAFFIPMVIYAFTWKRSIGFFLRVISKLLPSAVIQWLEEAVASAKQFIHGRFQPVRTSNATQDDDEDSLPDTGTGSSGSSIQLEAQERVRPSGLQRLRNMKLSRRTRRSHIPDEERGGDP